MYLKSVISFYFFFLVVYNKFLLIVMTDGHHIITLGSKVPQLVHYGSKVILLCRYKLGTSSLHSVEWYKDGRHFYTFIPQLKPQVKFFPLENIQFDISQSDMHRAALNNVTSEYSGNYKCEVFIENHINFTVQRINLTVFAYPDRDPIIQFIKHNYNSVEELEANCTSGRTIPPTTLFWFINGVEIDKKLVVKEEIKAIGRYFRTLSTIKFTVEKDSDKLVLGCVARILNSLPVTRTSAFIPKGKSLHSHSERLLHGSGFQPVFMLRFLTWIIYKLICTML